MAAAIREAEWPRRDHHEETTAMHDRPADLEAFLANLQACFDRRARRPPEAALLGRAFGALRRARPVEPGQEERLAVCDYLPAACRPESYEEQDLARLSASFLELDRHLCWRRRSGPSETASMGFGEGHANAMIIGPGGFERRADVWVGATLLAPQVRFPDHRHPPEEVYLTMGAGDLWHDGAAWTGLEAGEIFHNPPGITHAMRSGTKPFLTFWVLHSRSPRSS